MRYINNVLKKKNKKGRFLQFEHFQRGTNYDIDFFFF